MYGFGALLNYCTTTEYGSSIIFPLLFPQELDPGFRHLIETWGGLYSGPFWAASSCASAAVSIRFFLAF